VINKQKNLESKMTLDQLGKAMSELDLANIPDANKPRAIREHLTKIMAETILDPNARADLQVAAFKIRNNLK
jgi:hypothetical protein